MRRILMVAFVAIGLGACSTPDLKSELGSFGQAVGTVTGDVRPILERDLAAEMATRRDSAVRDGKAFYTLPQDCLGQHLISETFEQFDCTMSELRGPGAQPTDTAKMLTLLNLTGAYFEALSELALSDSPQKIKASATEIAKTITAVAATLGGSGVIVGGAAEFAALSIGLAAEQYRSNVVRSAVRNMDPLLRRAVVELTKHLIRRSSPVGVAGAGDETRDPLVDALTGLRSAHMDAERRPDDRAAVLALEDAYIRFVEVEPKSPVIRLHQIAKTHGALARRVETTATAEEIIAFADRLESLITLLKTE